MCLEMENTLVKFVPSSELLKFIESEVESMEDRKDIPRGIQSLLASKDKSKAVVCLEDLHWVKERRGRCGHYLWDLVVGSELILPSPPVLPRNPVLEARCQRLQKEQEAREYRAMTKMVDPRRYREPEESIAYSLKQINRQLIGVVQLLFSVAAGFLFGYLGLELIFGGLDMRVRLLSGIGCALIIAIADLYFLIMHLSVEEAATDAAANKETLISSGQEGKTSRPHQD